MQEIKFRAWDTKKKEMFVPQRMIYNRNDEIFLIDKIGENRGSLCILMQYTGFHDKNGKEIYEGDIVETRWSRLTIRRSNSYAMFRMFNVFGNDAEGEPIYREGACAEIIGNIYENPELIENLIK